MALSVSNSLSAYTCLNNPTDSHLTTAGALRTNKSGKYAMQAAMASDDGVRLLVIRNSGIVLRDSHRSRSDSVDAHVLLNSQRYLCWRQLAATGYATVAGAANNV